jgi:hypothetical protein
VTVLVVGGSGVVHFFPEILIMLGFLASSGSSSSSSLPLIVVPPAHHAYSSAAARTRRLNRIGSLEPLRSSFFDGFSSMFGSGGGNPSQQQVGGTGLIEIQLSTLKAGGFKLWLFFFLLGQGKNDLAPFTVRETGDGIRILLIDSESETTGEYLGVLDVVWEDEKTPDGPFLRVDRIDPDEQLPYVGELEVLRMIVDALEEIHLEDREEEERLFTLRSTSGIQDAKAKLKARTC